MWAKRVFVQYIAPIQSHWFEQKLLMMSMNQIQVHGFETQWRVNIQVSCLDEVVCQYEQLIDWGNHFICSTIDNRPASSPIATSKTELNRIQLSHRHLFSWWCVKIDVIIDQSINSQSLNKDWLIEALFEPVDILCPTIDTTDAHGTKPNGRIAGACSFD